MEVGQDPHADVTRFLQDQDELAAGRTPQPAGDSVERHMQRQINAIRMGVNSIIFEPYCSTRNEKISVGERTRIDSFTKLEGGKGLQIGSDIHIASFAHINIGGGRTVLKDGSAVASGGRIISGGNQVDSISCSAVAKITEQVLGDGCVVLEKNACIYAGSTVYSPPGKTVILGEGSRLGMHSFTMRSIPAGEFWAGAPAKFIRKVEA